MELLKSLSRHLTVQKRFEIAELRYAEWRKELCVTAAIDHSTVDGFHDELQLSAKNT